MNSGRRASLNAALAEIRQRWGSQAVQRLDEDAPNIPHPCIPTGSPPLDELLGGGMPRNRITELCGSPTSGATSLALQTAIQAQAAELAVVCIDVPHALAPGYAVHAGLDLDQLLFVRPDQSLDVLEIAGDFVLTGSVDLLLILVAHTPLSVPSGAWQKLAVRVAKSDTVLILTSPEGRKLSTDQSYVSLRLRVERTRWLWEENTFRGWESRVTIAKNKLGAAGQSATLTIRLPKV